jgi:hypothetical protein
LRPSLSGRLPFFLPHILFAVYTTTPWTVGQGTGNTILPIYCKISAVPQLRSKEKRDKISPGLS